MLDHLFLDTVAAVRAALDASLLERPGQDDRLVFDLLTGDIVWETTVSLPGDGDPPRVTADLSLDWQTWSQSAWRSLTMGETVEDPPEIGIEIVFRAQRLAKRPPLGMVLSVLPEESPEIGCDRLTRSSPVLEEALEEEGAASEVAVEVAYEGSYRIPAPAQAEPEGKEASLFPGAAAQRLNPAEGLRPYLATTRQLSAAAEASLNTLGTWLASTLVRLADLPLEYLPPPESTDN
ncbi:MAG TPA: hypothetical protein VME20_01540 [Acidimicrobiales bacterium]|nr:hypothetical protein [Acidimicrobiales bacterium]